MGRRMVIAACAAAAVIFGASLLIAAPQEKADDFAHITFTSSGDSFRLFDHRSGRIYMYSSTRGDLYRIFTLKELGKDLIGEKLGN